VPACDVRKGLQIHHWGVPVAKLGKASMDNCCRVCRWHHYLITHHGYDLRRAGDRWTWIPPPVLTE
jgi:hypothetical protein